MWEPITPTTTHLQANYQLLDLLDYQLLVNQQGEASASQSEQTMAALTPIGLVTANNSGPHRSSEPVGAASTSRQDLECIWQ
jgi:hypothetical protein